MHAKSKKRVKYEEIVNSTSHGVGILLAIAGTTLLAIWAALYGNVWHIVSYSIFGVGMIVLYSASTVFHGAKNLRKKYHLNKFDHSSIYLLIAATYTPFSIVGIRGALGWVIFGLVWVMAICGIVYKVWFYTTKWRNLSTWLYLAMGWIGIIAIVPIIQNLPNISLWFLLSGGIAYSVGVVFYLNRNIPYGHGIFHLFIICGSICHFFSLLFMI